MARPASALTGMAPSSSESAECTRRWIKPVMPVHAPCWFNGIRPAIADHRLAGRCLSSPKQRKPGETYPQGGADRGKGDQIGLLGHEIVPYFPVLFYRNIARTYRIVKPSIGRLQAEEPCLSLEMGAISGCAAAKRCTPGVGFKTDVPSARRFRQKLTLSGHRVWCNECRHRPFVWLVANDLKYTHP